MFLLSVFFLGFLFSILRWVGGGWLAADLIVLFLDRTLYIFSPSLSGNRLPMSVNLSLTAPRETLRWPDDRIQRTCSRVLLHRT
jgi:hypothetical protein